MKHKFYASSHSELWDSRLPKYRNKHFKNSLWTSVKLSFEASIDIECTVEHLQAKFASLRNIFARELRKKNQTKISGEGTEDLYRSTWPYFQHLQFLLPVMSITIPIVTNLDTDTPAAQGEMVTEEDQNEVQVHTSSEGVGNTSIEWEDGNAMGKTAETSEQNFVKSNKKRKRNASDDLTVSYSISKKRSKKTTVCIFYRSCMGNAPCTWHLKDIK